MGVLLFFLSHKLPPPLFSQPLKESSSGAVGVRAQLRQHKPANSLPQIPPIPLHSLLIPGLIIPRLWQSSARQTSAESAPNGPRASSLCFQQTDRIHHSLLGRPLCMLYFTGISRSPPREKSEKRVYFCKMSDTHSFAHLPFLWWSQTLFLPGYFFLTHLKT